MTRLRVRSGADIHLADAFELPGCPLCRERHRTERNYLESILAESVLDVGFRQALDAARGFCGRHARAFLDAERLRSGTLGTAILLRASLVARLPEIEAAADAKGWTRSRRASDARRRPACPACERVRTADGHAVDTVVRLAEDAAWAEAAATAPFCLDHLLALMDRRQVPPWWPSVEARQVARLRELRDRLDRFAHASAHDRRHLQTDDQRASVAEAVELFAGSSADQERPGARAATTVDRAAVLLTGVYGSGKTTLAIELVDRLETLAVPAAAIDLDWLGWYAAPVPWDEHEDPRLTLEHLALVAGRYAGVGVRRFVLAGTIPPGTRDRFADAVGVPLTVVRLDADADVLRRRLASDPNASRAHDLARALETLAAQEPDQDDGADWSVAADRPVRELADEVLGRLGWVPG